VPPAASALAWLAFFGALEAASQVAGSFSLNSSASRLYVLGPAAMLFKGTAEKTCSFKADRPVCADEDSRMFQRRPTSPEIGGFQRICSHFRSHSATFFSLVLRIYL
jgi:hypothetical protein